MAPFGKYTAPNRRGGIAAARASGVNAGIMDSRNGRLTAVPMALSFVRRDSDFLVTNICSHLHFFLRSHLHLKWKAPNDAQHQTRKFIAIAAGVPDDGSNRRHIPIVD